MTKQPYDPAYRGSSASHPARNEGGHLTLSRLFDLSGKAASTPYYSRIAGIGDDQSRKILDNNILASHWLVQMVQPGMIEWRHGAVFLASPARSFTGQTFVIDGGYTVQGP